MQDYYLTIFGWAATVLFLWLAGCRYLFGKGDLFTSRNLFLGGCAIFIGNSSVNCGTLQEHYRNYTPEVYYTFYGALALFFLVFWVVYDRFSLPEGRPKALYRWPKVSMGGVFFLALCALGLNLIAIVVARVGSVQVLQQVVFQIGTKGAPFAVALMAYAWMTRKKHEPIGVFVLGVLIVAAVMATLSGGGRRMLVAVILAIPIVVYWLKFRYQPRTKTILAIAVVIPLAFLFLTGYASTRHFDRGKGAEERNVQNTMEALQSAISRAWTFFDDVQELDAKRIAQRFGQNATECSLCCIELFYYGKVVPTEPFNTVIFVASNPVPRAFWPTKPEPLGYTLPKLFRLPRVSWGPGIIGHSFHEGGWLMVVFYGALLAICLKTFDQLLVRQPQNPLLMGCLAAASGNIFGLSRGDMGTMGIQIISCILAMLVLRFLGNIQYGSAISPKGSFNPFDRSAHRRVAARMMVHDSRQLPAR